MLLRAAFMLAVLTLAGFAPGVAPEQRDAPPDVRVGWSRLPDPTFQRSGSALVWTGSALLVWGGAKDGSFKADGALYDAPLRSWRPIAPAPLAGRTAAAAVWTGSELIVWGGWAGGRTFAHGAAFDPATGAWRLLTRAPLSARMPAASVWTGKELLVWGDSSRFRAARDGAAYDPRADSWRRLPAAPLALNQVTSVWVAGRMIAFGALLDGGNLSRARYARGIAYTPATDRWRVLPSFPLSPQASTLAAVGGRAVVWDYGLQAGVYDPRADRWTKLPSLPLRPGECYPTSVSVARLVLAWYCGTGALFDPRTRRWRRVLPPQRTTVLDEPVAAGPAALFLGSPRGGGTSQLWAYRPAAS